MADCSLGLEGWAEGMLERVILIGMWSFGTIGFLLLIPRRQWREGIMAGLIFQTFIWGCDMPAFQFGLLSAPVREFPQASDLAITIIISFIPLSFPSSMFTRDGKAVCGPDFVTFSFG